MMCRWLVKFFGREEFIDVILKCQKSLVLAVKDTLRSKTLRKLFLCNSRLLSNPFLST